MILDNTFVSIVSFNTDKYNSSCTLPGSFPMLLKVFKRLCTLTNKFIASDSISMSFTNLLLATVKFLSFKY